MYFYLIDQWFHELCLCKYRRFVQIKNKLASDSDGAGWKKAILIYVSDLV